MRCPVCGKHVAEERYEVHVGRHTDVGADAAPAELESIPAAVGASTLESVAPGASVDASALLLGPEGSAMPLQEHVAERDAEESVAIASSDDETTPVELDDDNAVAAPEEVDAEASPTVVEDEALVVEDEAPVEATAPLAVEAPAAWGAPPVAPFEGEAPATGRRSALPILGLVALVIAAAIVVFSLTRDDGGTKKSARVKATATTTKPTFGSVATPGSPGATSPRPTFPPSPTGYSPQAPPLAIPPPAPGVAPPPGASAPPGSTSAAAGQIQVTPASAECDEDAGRLVVNGTIVNRGSARYNVQFTVSITSASGAPLGSAQGAAVVGPGESKSFQATGACSGPLGPGNRQQTQIQSVTPA